MEHQKEHELITSENRFKVELIFHKLGIIILSFSDKIEARDGNTRPDTNKYIHEILNKMQNEGINLDLNHNSIFQKVGSRHGNKIITYKDCFYEFKELFRNPTNAHVKFLEMFAEGFSINVSEK